MRSLGVFRILVAVLAAAFVLSAPAEEAGLPRVLIIGDSISIGYTPPLVELLAGKAEVIHNPGNARSSRHGRELLEEWLGTQHWDVIHFNFGLHDFKFVDAKGENVATEAEGQRQVPLGEYQQNLQAIAARLKQTGAKLIFATTTPFPADLKGVPRRQQDHVDYNEAATRIMHEAGIPLNDLSAYAQPHLPQWQHPQDVHFTKQGSRHLAEEVARVILAALPPVPEAKDTPLGRAVLYPRKAVSATYGTWTVTYTVGSQGFGQGASLKVELPDAMHGGPRNSANRLQATEADAPHFVSARSSRPEVALQTTVELQGEEELVKHMKTSLDHRHERYVYVVRVDVKQGALQPGDTISVIYGNTAQGSPGYLAGDVVQGPEPVLVGVDLKGAGQYERLKPSPTLELIAGPVTEMLVHVPSRAAVGEAQTVKVALLDAAYNPASFSEPVIITLSSANTGLAQEVRLPADRTSAEVKLTPATSGVVRLTAVVNGKSLRAQSNPMEVNASAPEERILWGDLHSHTSYSWDGIGKHAFDYARYVSGLDFYARTDHGMSPMPEGPRGLHGANYEAYIAESESFHEPPAFVTIHGYECSFGTPYGHHNVYFRGAAGPLLFPQEVTLPELWNALKAGEALTIPHHTGKFPRPVDLGQHNPEFRRNFEIYSGHGLSEAYNPSHPLSFENSDFTADAVSQNAPSFAQDAWRMGQQMSVVAASDDHRAKPGQPHYGITAVFAPENTREAVFDALYHRRTYGTSGAKIILDFSLDELAMGQIGAVGEQPVARIHAVGTDTIGVVELLHWQPGSKGFEVLQRWEPNTLDFDVDYTVKKHTPGAVYYVRLFQTRLIRTRAAVAWSSPVWTDPKMRP